MIELNFYTTLGCHLCDEANQLLKQINSDIKIISIDIADDDMLIEQYGTLIPVITTSDKKHMIQWPFTLTHLQAFIQSIDL